MLRGAGVSVLPTAALADPAFRGSGRILQIGGQLVQVYEYDSTAERQTISDVILAGSWPSLAEKQPPPQGTAVWTTGKLIVVYAGSDGGTHMLLQALLGDPITLAPVVVDELRRRGHDVDVLQAFDETMGHAQAILRHPDGVLEGRGSAQRRGVGGVLKRPVPGDRDGNQSIRITPRRGASRSSGRPPQRSFMNLNSSTRTDGAQTAGGHDRCGSSDAHSRKKSSAR